MVQQWMNIGSFHNNSTRGSQITVSDFDENLILLTLQGDMKVPQVWMIIAMQSKVMALWKSGATTLFAHAKCLNYS